MRHTLQVRITDPVTSNIRKFQVTTTLVQTISLTELMQYCR